MSEQLLWECRDHINPNYSLRVIRLSSDTGELIVSFNEEPFYREEVSLAYGAKFGPDIFDIEAWAHIACDVTQKHEAEHR